MGWYDIYNGVCSGYPTNTMLESFLAPVGEVELLLLGPLSHSVYFYWFNLIIDKYGLEKGIRFWDKRNSSIPQVKVSYLNIRVKSN